MPVQFSEYWANLDVEELGEKLAAKVETYGQAVLLRGLHERFALAYQYYFGLDPSGIHATSQILRGGQQGELAEIRVNHARPLVNTLLNLIVAPKIVWSPKAVNIDYDSNKQTLLAKAVLEYYWDEKRVSAFSVRALEEAIVFGEGYALLQWDYDSGEDYLPALDQESLPERTGDICLYNVSAWDVIRDPAKNSYDELDWVIVRVRRNKYDLAAQYPEHAEDVLKCGDDHNDSRQRLKTGIKEESDDVACYYFFHRRSPSMPNGRETVFIHPGVILHDDDLSYDEIPLYRVSAGETFATPYGYTPFFDILGVQELIDSLETSIASNQTTFATQNIVLPEGSNVGPDDLAGGLKVIYYPGDLPKPEALQLTATPAEVFKHLESLKKDQQLLIGLNSVVRGEAQSGEMSGSALALLQSQALQQSSNIQASYLRFVQRLGNGVFQTVKARLDLPMQISLAGRANDYLVESSSFTGKSFERIKRVQIDIGNPMAQTPAGRTELAQLYMNLGLAKGPEQFEQVLSTGRLEPLTQSLQQELMLVRAENEALQRGELVQALILDDHNLHAREHRAVLANPNARKNPEIVRAVLAHIDEHERLYYSAPPQTLAMMGQPPPAVPPPPGGPGGPPPGPGPGPEGAPPEGPPPGVPNGEGEAKPPRLPTNPSTDQQWDPATGGGAVNPPA